MKLCAAALQIWQFAQTYLQIILRTSLLIFLAVEAAFAPLGPRIPSTLHESEYLGKYITLHHIVAAYGFRP